MALRKVREIFEDDIRFIVYDMDTRVLGDRKRKQIKVRTKGAAIELYKRWLDRLASGECNYTLFDKFDEYLIYTGQHMAALNVCEKKRHVGLLKAHFGNVPLQSIKRHHVEDYIPWRRKHRLDSKEAVSNATINRDLATLHHFFNWCLVREYYTGMNPVYKTHLEEQNERVVSLSKDQIAEMFELANDYQRHFLMIVFYTGMRRGEICGLKWSQVDLESGMIHLEAHETKGKRRRDITIPDALLKHLKEQREKVPFETYVITYRGKRINSLAESWEALRRKLSFKAPDGTPLRFHDLRHCYASFLRKSGVELSEIKEFLGHSDIKVTERYAHYYADAKREKVNRLHEHMPESATRMA